MSRMISICGRTRDKGIDGILWIGGSIKVKKRKLHKPHCSVKCPKPSGVHTLRPLDHPPKSSSPIHY